MNQEVMGKDGEQCREQNGSTVVGPDNYKLLCAAQVNWYRRFGRYPARIRYDGHGVQYVIGDWSWKRVYPDFREHIEIVAGFPADLPALQEN